MNDDFLLESQIATDLNNHRFVAPSIKGYVDTAMFEIKQLETKAEMLWSEKKITKITRDKLISNANSLRYCVTQMNNEQDVLISMLEQLQKQPSVNE